MKDKFDKYAKRNPDEHRAFSAVRRGDLSALKFCLEHLDVNVNAQNALGLSLLHFAVNVGNDKFVTYLIQQGADINHSDCIDRTPLHQAARTGNDTISQLLLDADAHPYKKDQHGKLPSTLAFDNGHYELATKIKRLEDDDQLNMLNQKRQGQAQKDQHQIQKDFSRNTSKLRRQKKSKSIHLQRRKKQR